MNFLERYFIAKESSKKEKQEEYKKDLQRLVNEVNEALDKQEDYMFFGDLFCGYKCKFAEKFGFKTEYHSWGAYVYFNKKALIKLEKKAKELNII